MAIAYPPLTDRSSTAVCASCRPGLRPTFHPAKFADGVVTPLPWAGSADLRTVATADGFAAFPAGDREHKLGDPIGFLRL